MIEENVRMYSKQEQAKAIKLYIKCDKCEAVKIDIHKMNYLVMLGL